MYLSIHEKIEEFNKKFNIDTVFLDMDMKGYSYQNTIYINSKEEDVERINKHELLHFFANDDTFKLIKSSLNISDELRKEYVSSYMKLYNSCDNDIIDDEITIEHLVNGFNFEYNNGLKVDDYLFSKQEELKTKKYLSLNMTSQVKDMNLSTWEKIFVINYYSCKEHIMPHGKEKYIQVRNDIKFSLENLYRVAENEDAFMLDPHSPEILRDYDNELCILEGQGKDTSYHLNNKEKILEDTASKISHQLYEEYNHLVNNIKLCPYEDAFKVMMLYETLTKIYRFEAVDNKRNTFVSRRKMCESIKSHMILNQMTLEIIYKEITKYNKFSDLYFDALEVYSKKIVEKSNIKLNNVLTYGKGKWIRFEDKNTNPKEYSSNVQRLASLVKDTQWCTKYLSSNMLSEGDLYVFVDNNNKPHLAVKLSGNEIDEVRGIDNGSNQEIESDYRDVIISFLSNNTDIKYGLEWLEKEEWNRRLIKYNILIEKGKFTYDMVNPLMNDLADYNKCKYSSTQKEILLKNLPLIVSFLAKYFNCEESEICTESINFEDYDYDVCPYKIILGDANFSSSKIKSTGLLEIVTGDVETYDSKLEKFDKIYLILGNADLSFSNIKNLGSLTVVGGDLDINSTPLESLNNLSIIGGNAYLSNPNLKDLGNLRIIFRDGYFNNSSIESTNNLDIIYGNAIFDGEINVSSLNQVLGSIVYSKANYDSLEELKRNKKLVLTK